MNEDNTKLLELLDRSGAKLFTLLTRLTLREDIAQELMQDLFIKLSNAQNKVDIDSLDAYACRAAINLAFDWRRKNIKRIGLPLDAVSEQASQNKGPLDNAIEAEELQKVLSAIGLLNGMTRQVFVMHHIQQDSFEDIAARVGKTAHQTRALCFKAMGNIRNILGCNYSPDNKEATQNVEE